jgi:glycosyltransferase involved in cell wall biosynthesis
MFKLHKQIPGLTLAIIGVKSDSDYYDKLYDKINELGLNSNVRLFADIPFQETLHLLKNSGIFVLHSQEESQGIVLCEAMAAGKPVVSTNVGGIPFIIKHGINGLISEFGDIEGFSNNIWTLINNEQFYEYISLNNRHTSAKYKWSTITNELLELYRQIMLK